MIAYYVSIRDEGRGGQTILASGPYPTHERALEDVDAVRRATADVLGPTAIRHSFDFTYGTCSSPDDRPRPHPAIVARLEDLRGADHADDPTRTTADPLRLF